MIDDNDCNNKKVTILASNEVTVPGLHGHPLRALGVLPWVACLEHPHIPTPSPGSASAGRTRPT